MRDACAVLRQLFVAMGYDLFGIHAHHDVHDVVHLELALHGLDNVENLKQVLAALNVFMRMQTVVATVAVVLGIRFSEVVQQQTAAAHSALHVCLRFGQQLVAYVLFCHGLAFHELSQFHQVLGRVERHAHALASISAGTSRLLIISFQALGYVVMYHKPHIGFVDTHTECYGGHNHIQALHDEVVLGLVALRRLHTGMVGACIDIVGPEYLRQLLHLLARQAVHYAALAGVLQDEADDVLVHVLGLGAHLIVEVGAIEGTDKIISLQYAQTLLYVAAYLVRGRGGKRYDGSTSNLIDYRTYPAVFRTEVVSPLGDTVCLVHGIETYLYITQEILGLLLGKRLWSHIKQFRAPCLDILLDLIHLLTGKAGVQIMCNAIVLADLAYGIHLILHQGYKGRQDYRSALHYQGRQLVAQALSSARRHQDKRIVPSQKVVDDILLLSLERTETEIAL